MARTSRTPLLVLAAALVAVVLGGILWVALAPTDPPEESAGAAAPGVTAAAPVPDPEPEDAVQLVAVGDEEPQSLGSLAETTVLRPVHVELDLVRPAGHPKVEGVPALGSGRTARLEGSLVGAGGRGLPGSVRFTAGSNRGRVLQANAEGQFGASDLYPGLNVVAIEAPGTPGSVREVRLRQNQTEQLHVSYGMPGSFHGQVFGGEEPLEGARVELDGLETTTDAEGLFHFPAVAAGDRVPIVVSKAGWSTYTEPVAVPAGRSVERGRYRFRLEPAATLSITIADRVGGPGEAEVVLLPDPIESQRVYPWHRVNPLKIVPGATAVLDDLPPGRVGVRAYHAGAIADPQHQVAILHPGQTASVQVRLKPAPGISGVVRDPQGLPVRGARVVLEAPDRAAVSLLHLGKLPMELESQVVPTLGPQAQETVTDDAGRFVLTAWGDRTQHRYLTASSPDGSLWAARVVGPEADEIELRLEPVREGSATLRLRFPGRHQGLPVVVVRDGQPGPEQVLAADEELVIEDLPEGTWRLRPTWESRPLLPGRGHEELELEGDVRRAIPLPQGAVQGQDPEAALRARGG